MTIRLSQSSLTGTDRTEVAVGTDSESSMLATVRAGAPRSTVYVGWSVGGLGSGALPSLGVGRPVLLAFSAAVSGRGRACGAGVAVAFCFTSGVGFATGFASAVCFASPPAFGSEAGFAGAVGRAADGEAEAGGAAAEPLPAGVPLPLALKYAAQVGSTLPGSRWNWSYIS